MPITLTATFVVLSSLPATAGVARVDVCHMSDAHSWHLITVAESAVPAHLAHGDWLPSEEVLLDEVDNDCDGLVDEFEPDLFEWELYTGIQDGEVTSVWADGVEYPPTFRIWLAEWEYYYTGDLTYVCTVPFTFEATPGTSDPDAWYDWALTLTPFYVGDSIVDDIDICDDLDPGILGEDPWALFAAWSWEMSMLAMDEPTAANLQEWRGEDWLVSWEPYLFGSDTWLDGWNLHELTGTQIHYGVAYSVDDDMNFVGDALETEEVAAGSDGLYYLQPVWIWSL